MFLLQTTINIGETAEKISEHWYNENWVGFILTALSAIVAALVAIGVVMVDHKKQRIAREEEEAKNKEFERNKKVREITDLRNYFFAMCDALLDLVQEQIEIYKKLKEDLGTKQYEPVVRKILELNLDRVYHLTPTQVFEVFVTEANGDSKENAKRYVEIYRNFEKILVVKKLEDDYANRSTKMLETSFAAFIKVAQDLDTYKRQIIHEIVATHGNISHPFAQDLSSIFIDWGIASKKLKRVGNEVSAVDDSELVNEEKINTVLITKTYLFDKLIVLFNKDEYVASPYRFTFVNLINNGMIQMKEYNVTVHYYKTGIQNNIDTLTKVNDSLKTQIKELRELHE